MCGIAGIFSIGTAGPLSREPLARMIGMLAHRGPDGCGFFLGRGVGLAHARLSIVDLEGGWQPIPNEDRTSWIIFNGEIYNHPELRTELEARGHRFSTRSDTEVILHLHEEKGEGCLADLNGQFAIAIYDAKKDELFLARDRLGVRPLFYTVHQGSFYFASEAKSLFAADPGLPRRIDPAVLDEIFTFWMPAADQTIFSGVRQVPAGHWVRVTRDGVAGSEEYWDLPFTAAADASQPVVRREEDYAAGLRELLIDAVRLRLRADVPVGAYLSGGLDSSAITSIVRNFTANPLKTFSVTFDDAVYDESEKQREMAEVLRTDHHAINCGYRQVSEAFPDVVWHTEVPILRTAPAPLYTLSSLVRETGYKVVLTGEGADEMLGGYDIFKEAKIRAFIGRRPSSACRPLLLKRLYPYLALSPSRSAEYARQFFATDLSRDDPFFSHRPRWRTTSGTKLFFTEDVLRANAGSDPIERLGERYAGRIAGLDLLSRAQYLESRTLLSNYLLSSQGDRMAMAHSVEGRYPFLDHRVIAYACAIPPDIRMRALDEKHVLKRAMRDLLPPSFQRRKKQPYMAPDILSFFGDGEPAYLSHYLSNRNIREAGFFKPEAVSRLLAKCRRGERQGFRENMAFVGILSTQILHEKFVQDFRPDSPPQALQNVKVFSAGEE